MLSLRLNRVLLALVLLLLAISLAVNGATYGGPAMLPYLAWFSGLAGLLIPCVLFVLLLLCIAQVSSIRWQLPKGKGVGWILLLAGLCGVYGLYNAITVFAQGPTADPITRQLYSIRTMSIANMALALGVVSYPYRLIMQQRGGSNGTPLA